MPSPEFLDEYITFVCSHLNDPQIPNPDTQEGFLTKLNLLLQYSHIIPHFQANAIANKRLVTGNSYYFLLP